MDGEEKEWLRSYSARVFALLPAAGLAQLLHDPLWALPLILAGLAVVFMLVRKPERQLLVVFVLAFAALFSASIALRAFMDHVFEGSTLAMPVVASYVGMAGLYATAAWLLRPESKGTAG